MLSDTLLHPDAAKSLAMAVIDSSDTPLVLLDGSLDVVAASASFGKIFELDCAKVAGQSLSSMGDGEWALPQLQALLEATASGFAEVEAYEMDLKREGKSDCRLVVSARKLDYDDGANVRLVVSFCDVTDARQADKLKDDLLREKAILLQELQHRVANSLQIVASVLMQSARRVQSDEARVHLTDAHSRVMSIATLQQQLTVSRLGEVELRPYLTALCQSIAASMIHDKAKITLDVTIDDSIALAEVSVSIGLIVTELAINALKHAFPGRTRGGNIHVDYATQGTGWTLTVKDDGVGMPDGNDKAVPGLGSSIVAALARQLGATVRVTDANPGTAVSVVHA
jgi:two-component system, sensor histidine kinase PdtaS